MSSEYKTKYSLLRDKLKQQVCSEENKYPLTRRESMLIDVIDELLTELDRFAIRGTVSVYTEREDGYDDVSTNRFHCGMSI